MRALIFTLLLTTLVVSVQASMLSDSTSKLSDRTTIVIDQPDSITKKVVYLLLEANELTEEKPLEALKNYRKALIINKVKDPVWEADIRLAMGKILYTLKSKNAIPELVKADALYKRKGYLPGRANAVHEIAKIQEAQGLFTIALKNYNELYRILNKTGESVLAGNVATYLTDIFIKNRNYTAAFSYADMAKDAYYNVCRKDSLGSIYYRIAYIKGKLKSPKLAEYYILNHALSYYRSAGDLEGRLKSFDFLGNLYKSQKRYSEAKWFYLQANKEAREMSDTANTIVSLINLTVTKILIGDLVLAKQDIAEAQLLSESDSVYAPIMKKAKIRYATLFKKLNEPIIASNTTKTSKKITTKPAKTAVKPKLAIKKTVLADKSAAPIVLIDTEANPSEAIIETGNK